MSRSARAKPQSPSDELRNLLDKLAEKAVSTILADVEATPRAMSDVLKVAGTYWALSRKGDPPEKAPSAWEKYGAALRADGKEYDAAPN